MMLTEQQQRELTLLASLGCDRQTGCHYVACTPGELSHALQTQSEFAAQLLRAEATAEVAHMRCVHDAVKDAKQWRAAVWWLERRAPDRFARKPSAHLTADELHAAIEQLAGAIGQEIADPLLRQRIRTRLQQIVLELTHAFDLAAPSAPAPAADDDPTPPADDSSAWQA